MGFKVRWALSVALLALPIAITLGVLLGIDSHRKATGQGTFFQPEVGPKSRKGVEYLVQCDKDGGFGKEFFKQKAYEYNANPWGVKEGESGGMCMKAVVNNNSTYKDNGVGPFSVTWNFPTVRQSDPVHAYPNVLVHNVFPKKLSSISKVNFDFEWTYAAGSQNKTTSDFASLKAPDVLGNANVAIDIFVDKDQDIFKDYNAKSKFEIMVWFAAIGEATKPVGFDKPKVTDVELDAGGTDKASFELRVGENAQDAEAGGKQVVYTWYTATPIEKFHGDISPLIKKVFQLSKTDTTYEIPSEDDYAVYMAMGSELYSAQSNVTFYVPDLAVDVETK